MRSSRYFIIEAPETHKEKEGDIILAVSFENQQKVRQFQKIVSVPDRYKGKVSNGDLLCIHFNVLRFEKKDGVKTPSPNHLKDDFYYVPDTMAHFAIRKDGSLFFIKDDCIVEGKIGRDEIVTDGGIILPDVRNVMEKKADEMDGYIYAKADGLDDIEVGDKVHMAGYSDYEIEFPDGKKRWLVPYRSLLFKYEV